MLLLNNFGIVDNKLLKILFKGILCYRNNKNYLIGFIYGNLVSAVLMSAFHLNFRDIYLGAFTLFLIPIILLMLFSLTLGNIYGKEIVEKEFEKFEKEQKIKKEM